MTMMSNETKRHEMIVIGGGPAGIACALEAGRRGVDAVVLEKGTVVNTIVGYPVGVTFFSTPELLSIGGYPFTTPNMRPKREEAIAYYRGVVRASGVPVDLGVRVEGVERIDEGFQVRTDHGLYQARYVVLATGYFDQTNRLNIPGEDLPKVHHYYREPYDFFGRDVMVIGGRNSAVEAALDLWRNGARVTMIHRGAEFHRGIKYWIRPDIENRIKNGEITMLWQTEVERIEPASVLLRNTATGERMELKNDALFAMIGYRPDAALFESCGIGFDPETLVPIYDRETYETNVPGLYLAGSVACGCKTWEIFIENGRQHALVVAGEVAARLARDRGAVEQITEAGLPGSA